jgi:hypothetical protein
MAQKNVLPQVPSSVPASVPGTSSAAGGAQQPGMVVEIRDGIREIRELLLKLTIPPPQTHVPHASPDSGALITGLTAVQMGKNTKPVVLFDGDRMELERLFGGDLLHTGADVVQQVRAMTTLSINGSAIELPADMLARVDSRRPIDTTLVELLQAEVTAFLERYVDGSY